VQTKVLQGTQEYFEDTLVAMANHPDHPGVRREMAVF
jgi:hypothetical protein